MAQQRGYTAVRMPNAENAVVGTRKLRDYCLSFEHPRGRYKAQAFISVLGLTAADAPVLRDALLEAARKRDAAVGEHDGYGRRYTVDFPMSGPGGHGTVRSAWIVHSDEDFPRLVSCYVL